MSARIHECSHLCREVWTPVAELASTTCSRVHTEETLILQHVLVKTGSNNTTATTTTTKMHSRQKTCTFA
jgi:hypothetical protein